MVSQGKGIAQIGIAARWQSKERQGRGSVRDLHGGETAKKGIAMHRISYETQGEGIEQIRWVMERR